MFSQDNLKQIDIYNNDKLTIEGSNTLELSKEDTEIIKLYHKKKSNAENLRGNARRKEFVKVDNMRKDIRNFQQINTKYEKFLKQKHDLKKIEENIEYLKGFVNQDVDRMVRYLKDNNYKYIGIYHPNLKNRWVFW